MNGNEPLKDSGRQQLQHIHFYIENKGWVKVKDLEIGDKLLSTDKVMVILESKEIIDWKSKVYNFEVDGLHNYFITKRKS